MRKTSQETRVLNYMLETGGITTWEAIKELGCTRLSAKIYTLKKSGWAIGHEVVKAKNRYGDPVHYHRYFIAAAPSGESA